MKLCPKCKGEGKDHHQICHVCEGEGRITDNHYALLQELGKPK